MEAGQRLDELLEAAQSGQAVDGVVPAVIEIRRVRTKIKKLAPVDGNGAIGEKARREVRLVKTMLLATVDGPNDVVQSGPWAA